MIKGVNRQVVEINETGSEYFERAIFFVKPQYYGMGEGKLREKARLIAKRTAKPPSSRAVCIHRLKLMLYCSIAAVSGAAVSALICRLLF